MPSTVSFEIRFGASISALGVRCLVRRKVVVLFSVPRSAGRTGTRPPLRQNRTCRMLLFPILVVPSSIKGAYLRPRRNISFLSTCIVWAELLCTRRVTFMLDREGSTPRIDLLTFLKSYSVALEFLEKPQVSALL